MSRPNNSIGKIKLPGENVERPIIPYALGYSSSNGYQATLPNSYEVDDVIALAGYNNYFSGYNVFERYLTIYDDGEEDPAGFRPTNIFNWSDPDLYIYSTGLAIRLESTDLKYNFPNRSGVLGLEVAIVDLENAPARSQPWDAEY